MEESLKKTVEKLAITKINRHIFLCCDQTKPKCSEREQSLESWNFLKKRLEELNLTGKQKYKTISHGFTQRGGAATKTV